MTTRTNTAYQDPRYLQLWLTYEWPSPAERVPARCAGCGWIGRRARRSVAARPCPRCAGPVTRRQWRGPAGRGVAGGTVVQLAHWAGHGDGRAGQPSRVVRRS